MIDTIRSFLPYLTLFGIAFVCTALAYLVDRHRFENYAVRLNGESISWPDFAEMLDTTGQRDEIDDAPMPAATLAMGGLFLWTLALILVFFHHVNIELSHSPAGDGFLFAPDIGQWVVLGFVIAAVLNGTFLGFAMWYFARSPLMPIGLGVLFFLLFLWFSSSWMPAGDLVASASAVAFLFMTIAMFPATAIAMWPT